MANIDDKIKGQLIDVFRLLNKETVTGHGDGWVNLVKFAPAIKEAGLDFRKHGFEKLGDFVKAVGLFESCYDNTKKVPVKYIREKKKTDNKTESNHSVSNKSIESKPFYNKFTTELLKEWALKEPIAVGYFQLSSDGSYSITDFRSESFRELKYPDLGVDDLEQDVIINGDKAINSTYKSNKYYKFEWTTTICSDKRGYKVTLARPIRLKNIKPQELIQTLHDRWNNPDAAVEMKDVINMVSTELMASSDGTFIYELLQNANDNPVEYANGNTEPVDVEFYVTENYLICRHSGDYFSPRDIAGVCKLGAGTKKLRKNAIGYKGIGFKTVFHSHGWVYIQSDDYSFHFAESKNRPWQIMPVWESPLSIDPEIKTIIDKDKDKFRVVTVMRPRDKSLLRDIKDKNYKFLLSDIFKDVRDIIFIPNINSVRIFDNSKEIVNCKYDDHSSWIRSSLPPFDLSDLQDNINKEIILHPERGIPGRYKDFGDTTVAFACKCKGKQLDPVENATVNCYLPTKAEFGFPFLMNTDMVPTGARDQLKLDVEFNATFAHIAGIKFVEWMKILINQEFEASSVLDLIPDFEQCRNGVGKHYTTFINQFETGFNEKTKSEAFIPTINKDGKSIISQISDILYDTTGLTESGIMSDADFFTISGVTSVLPIPSIRKNKNLKRLLRLHGAKNVFNNDKLVALCDNEAFQKWLQNLDNNKKWLDYLINAKLIKLFVNKKIFISGKTLNLVESKDLRYDSSLLRTELACFVSKYIDYLADDTFIHLQEDDGKRYKALQEAGFTWKLFYPTKFVESVLNCKEDFELLKQIDNSIGFYHMIARAYEKCFEGKNDSICKKFPLVVDNAVIDSIEGNIIYFESKEGSDYKSKTWIDNSWLYFLPEQYIEYDKEVMKPFFQKFINDFSLSSLVSDVLLTESHINAINKHISTNYNVNLEFVRLLYNNRDIEGIKDGVLQHYAIHCFDTNGESTYVSPKESPVYFVTTIYEDFVKHPWVEKNWLYALDDTYYKDLDLDSDEAKKNVLDFFEKKFKIRLSQKAKLCTEIAMPHLSDILLKVKIDKEKESIVILEDSILQIKASNLDFFKYLSENYTTIFEGSTNYFYNKSFPFIDSKGNFTDGPLFSKKFYSLSPGAEEVCNTTWLPQGFVKTISSEYQKAIVDNQMYVALTKKLGLSDFDYNTLMTEVILLYKEDISKEIKEIEKNKTFHGFFKKHLNKITLDNAKKLADFPVFLVGDNAPILSLSSKEHLMTNEDLMSLIDNGIILASSTNGIHKDYFDNSDEDQKYWKETLGNIDVDNQTIVSLLTGANISKVISNISKDEESNLSFWRVLSSFKDIKNTKLSPLKKLPILMKGTSNGSDEYVIRVLNDGEECYMSDVYFSNDGAIEYLVNEYAKGSWLLSPAYIKGSTVEEKKSWFSFWEKVGILSSNDDIILHTIIPHLDTKISEKIPLLLFNNKSLIEKKMDDKMKEDFRKLHLCTNDGMKPINEVYFIQNETTIPFEEPLPTFPLANQISSEYTKEQISFFLKLTDLTLKIITNQAEWFLPKISQYLQYQERAFNDTIDEKDQKMYYNAIDTIHLNFIENLAKFKSSYLLSIGLTSQDSSSSKILIKRRSDNCYVLPNTLTLGTIYKPYCDFQSHGIPELIHSNDEDSEKREVIIGLDYVSEEYSNIKEIIPLLNYLGTHHRFIRKDVDFLCNHDFCVYFWTNYVLDKDRWKEINDYIDEGVFNDIACVPTNSEVKKPDELYSRDLIEYVKRLYGGEDLIPLDIKKEIDGRDGITYPHPIYKFSFQNKLSKKHCFEFLLNSRNVENKKSVLRFLLEYKDNNQITKDDVDNYRQLSNTALWMNGQNDLTHVTELYAIGKDEEDVLYNIYLGSDQLVINNNNIPDTRFDEICSDVLGMKVLHAKDGVFETIPKEPKTDETEHIVPELKQKSLLLATILCEDQNWKELYNNYKKNIEKFKFIKCQSISIEYKEDHRLHGDDVATVHYDSSTSTFYYVNDWQDKFVFDQLLDFLIKEIGITSSQTLMIKRILDTNRKGRGIDEYVEKFCKKYYTDQEFVDTLADCYPETARNLHLSRAIELEEKEDFIQNTPDYESIMSSHEENNSGSVTEEETFENNTQGNNDYQTQKINNTSSTEEKDSSNQDIVSSEKYSDSNSYGTTHHEESESFKEMKDSNIEKRDEENINDNSQGSIIDTNYEKKSDNEGRESHIPEEYDYDTDEDSNNLDFEQEDYNGSIDKDPDYEPIGSSPHKPSRRRAPRPFTDEENERLRSKGTPLELESLPPTEEEIDILAQCGISVEQIADTNYLVQLRLYNNLIDSGEKPEETMEEFIRNAADVAIHKLTGDRYIHTCSAARGVMYTSPSVWNKMLDDKWKICVYLDGRGKNFHYINNAEEFLKLVEKDDVVIKITGKEKVDVVRQLYSGLLMGKKGTAYTLIRVASRTNMDAVFAHYVGAMAEADDGNDNNEY